MSITDKPHIVYDKEAEDFGPMPQRIVKKMQRGWEIQQELERLTKEQKAIKKDLETDYGHGVVLVLPGICRAPISQATTVRIADAVMLKELVSSEDYTRLVHQEVTFKPTEAYKSAILNEENDLHDLIDETAKVTHSVSTKFLPSK